MPGAVVALRQPDEQPAKRFKGKLTLQRERFADIVTEIGPLMRAHDAEVWPGRTWGPKGVKFNVLKYLDLEARGFLLIVTVRTGGGKLVGYCFEVLADDDHYGMRGAVNAGIFVHKDYRAGKGLSLRKSIGYRLLRERERLLDEFKIERRRIGVKLWLDFGKLLKLFDYSPDMIQHQKIWRAEEEE